MWRFVLKENIRRFRALLEHAHSEDELKTLRQLLEEAEEELGELEEISTPDIARLDASLQSVADDAMDQAIALSGAQFAALQIFDQSRDHLIILAQRNLRARFLHYLAKVRPGDGSACGRCLADQAPASIADVNRETGFEAHRDAASEAGIQALQAFPVRDRSGQLIAVLSTFFEAPLNLADDEVDRMTSCADAIGNKLEKHLRG